MQRRGRLFKLLDCLEGLSRDGHPRKAIEDHICRVQRAYGLGSTPGIQQSAVRMPIGISLRASAFEIESELAIFCLRVNCD